MTKIIYNKFDKEKLNELPQVTFEGRIIVILTPEDAHKAVSYLLDGRHNLLGVDTETRPSFHKGEQHKVSLLQVSTEDTCFLFRLNHTDMTPDIVKLLENTRVPMIGLSWHDDLLSLRKRKEFTPGRFIDLQDVAEEIGIEDKSLQKIYANVFHQKINKRQRLTNWDADVLNEKQKQYAAIDAWACVLLYKEIMRLKESGDYQLIVSPTLPPEGEEKSAVGKECAPTP